MIEILLVSSLATVLLVAGALLRRVQAGPAAVWLCGWIVAGTAGILVLVGDTVPQVRLLTHLLGALFPWLLLTGSYELEQRPVPAWLVPAGVGLGLVRVAVAAAVSPQAAYALALLVEPPVAATAAWIAARATWGPGASVTQRLLGPVMGVLAALGAFHVAWMALDLPVTPLLPVLWLAAAPLIVTEQVYAASERVREALEQRVAERTEELARLERQVQELHRLESLGRLSGGIAHDFNNLLSVILGNLRLVQGELPADSPLHARLDRIRSAADHAAKITDQMLVYAGRAQTVRKVFDLSSTLVEMEELLEASVPGGCQLEVVCEGRAFLEGDETQIRQVALNLVANASEALPEGLGRVCVRAGHARLSAEDIACAAGPQEARPGEYVYLEVEDSGPGMDRRTREHVFEPFFSTKFTGRGMGLATVLGIARSHHGVVQIDSAPRRGTRVRVLVPACRPLETAGEAPEVRAPRASWPEPGDGRLLVVDDDPDVLEVAQAFLERSGYEVVTESGGRAGIERFAGDPRSFDGVVLDVAMPDMSGAEVFRTLRRLRPGLPVVLASGYSEEFTSERFPACGATAFLRKPYEPEELVAKVRRALAEGAASREAG